MAICVVCSEPFNQRRAWAKKCFPCWKNEKKYPGFAPDELFDEEPLPGKKPLPDKKPLLDKRLPAFAEWEKMLMRLVKLSHPDRHANSAESNEVTRWLLAQRLKLR